MRPALAAALAILALALPCRPARGHDFAPGLLLLAERAPGVFSVTWRPPPATADGARLRPVLPAGCRPLPAIEGDLEVPAQVDCGPAGLGGATLSLSGAPSGRAAGEVVVEVRGLGGGTAGGVLRGPGDALTLPGSDRSLGAGGAVAVAAAYLRLGLFHILTGWDHLLLVFALLLLVPQKGSPAALLFTLTAFTLAHSLTLALAALGVLHVPQAPVEVLIALSVALLAAEIVRGPDRTLGGRRPALVAFLFGLLHGLGFAGALGEAGLPPGRVPLALLCFNLGVEGGQLLVVLCLWPAARALHRRAALLPPAYLMGALATAWTLDRLARMGS